MNAVQNFGDTQLQIIKSMHRSVLLFLIKVFHSVSILIKPELFVWISRQHNTQHLCTRTVPSKRQWAPNDEAECKGRRVSTVYAQSWCCLCRGQADGTLLGRQIDVSCPTCIGSPDNYDTDPDILIRIETFLLESVCPLESWRSPFFTYFFPLKWLSIYASSHPWIFRCVHIKSRDSSDVTRAV